MNNVSLPRNKMEISVKPRIMIRRMCIAFEQVTKFFALAARLLLM